MATFLYCGEHMTRIYAEDNWYETANKIYNGFEIGQSCNVFGVDTGETGEIEYKGKLVLTQLEKFYNHENVSTGGHRKKVKLPNTIGGYVAHKIFKFKEVTRDRVVITVIWRIQ